MSESKEFTALGLFSEMLPFLFPEGGSKEEMFAFYDECVAQVGKTFAPRPVKRPDSEGFKKPYERKEYQGNRDFNDRGDRGNNSDRGEYVPRSRGGVYASGSDGDRPKRPSSGGFKKEGGYQKDGGFNKKPRRYED